MIFRYVHSELITISVGVEKKKYHVYKALLTAKSPWFAARLTEKWQREPNEVTLEHHGGAAFDVVLDWMFRTSIDANPSFTIRDLIKELIPAYKLADDLLICALKNANVEATLEN